MYVYVNSLACSRRRFLHRARDVPDVLLDVYSTMKQQEKMNRDSISVNNVGLDLENGEENDAVYESQAINN